MLHLLINLILTIMKLFNFILFEKEKQQAIGKCPAQSVNDCSYASELECKFDKSNCHMINENNNQKKNDKIQLRVLLFIFFGAFCYLGASILKNSCYQFQFSQNIYEVISGISISVIAGAILFYIIDLPSKLKDYEISFLNALSSDSYLKRLDEDRLTKLRNRITEQLHIKNAPSMAKGLIEIDQRVCSLLREPYYSRYRQTVICSEISGSSTTLLKENIIDYKLINPYGKFRKAVEYIGFTNLIMMGNETDVNKFIYDVNITYSIDNTTKKDQSSTFELKNTPLNKKIEYYDTKVLLTSKDDVNKNINEDKDELFGIKVEFFDNIEVTIQYKIVIPKDDICFSKRMRHPVKNFRLDYSYKSDDVKLYGQLFGTEIKQSDISIKFTADNSISLETFDWLLPDNGAIVVITRK